MFIDNPLMRPPMPKPRRDEIEATFRLPRALDAPTRDHSGIDAFLERSPAPAAISA